MISYRIGKHCPYAKLNKVGNGSMTVEVFRLTSYRELSASGKTAQIGTQEGFEDWRGRRDPDIQKEEAGLTPLPPINSSIPPIQLLEN
jgi:hypothetical protein